MKRFLVFAGYTARPQGGWSDFRGWFDEEGYAVSWAKRTNYDWWHVYDTVSNRIVRVFAP